MMLGAASTPAQKRWRRNPAAARRHRRCGRSFATRSGYGGGSRARGRVAARRRSRRSARGRRGCRSCAEGWFARQVASNCFGTADPSRAPRPAAARMADTNMTGIIGYARSHDRFDALGELAGILRRRMLDPRRRDRRVNRQRHLTWARHQLPFFITPMRAGDRQRHNRQTRLQRQQEASRLEAVHRRRRFACLPEK